MMKRPEIAAPRGDWIDYADWLTSELSEAIQAAKSTKGWDKVPHKLHKALDAVFTALEATT
jgi:hypothetical protein